MSNDMNDVSLIGRVTKDPELKYTSNDKSVCNFSIAVNDDYGERKSVSFIEITCWAKQAEVVAQYVKKGQQVAIGGKLVQSRWEDSQTGQKRSKIGVVARNVQFLARARGSGESAPQGDYGQGAAPQNEGTPPPPSGPQTPAVNDDDDIPF